MELKCKHCKKVFDFYNDENCECESIDSDKVHIQYKCECSGKCPECSDIFNLEYTYWKEDNVSELLNGIEDFESSEVELIN